MVNSKLIKISKDKTIAIPYAGKYENSDGTIKHGVYVRKNKDTTDKLFINNGHLMMEYKYPNIERKFNSPKINDYNLHLCGGWSFKGVDREETITRVINDSKPMGFFITTEVKKWGNICKKSGLPYSIVPNHIPSKKHFSVGLSCNGTFGDNFNITNLAIDYANYSIKTKTSQTEKGIKGFVTSLENLKIASYLTSNYANPKSEQELIITGLILGYPIETTVAIMWM